MNLRRITYSLLPFMFPLMIWATPDEWLQKIDSTEDPLRQSDYYLDLAKELLSQPDEAIAYAEKGIQVSKEANYAHGEANLLNLIGAAYWYKQDLEQAISYYKQSLQLRVSGKEDAEIASNHNNIGTAYMVLGQFKEALPHIKTAYETRIKLGLQADAAGASANLGFAYSYLGQYEDAIFYMTEAADIAESLRDEALMSACYNSMGGMYFEIKNFPKATEYFNKALVIFRKLEDNDGIAASLGNLANIELDEGRFEAALKLYFEVIELEKDTQNLNHLAGAYNGIGNASKELGLYEQATAYLQKSIVANEQLGNRMANINVSINLAALDLKLAESSSEADALRLRAESVANAENALSLAIESESQSKQQEAYQQLYHSHRANGSFLEALEAHENFKTISDQILDATKHEQITELESKYQLATKTRDIETLQATQKIQELEIKEQQERMKAKNRLIIGILVFVGMLIASSVLFWKWNQSRQQNIKNELLIQNLRTEQKLLRSQMNPHFIYNSLNSIQAFISSNETYMAEKYLAKFASLMRGILENSISETVPFPKELAVIESYLELEKVRFQNRFDFKIELDEDFEDEIISIPPMLIQPFLENSILHGFRDVSEGLLTLKFSEVDDVVICEIDDNGIGRAAADKLPRKKNKTSLATVITNQRLKTISQQTGREATLEIIDKMDDSTGEASGTLVVLKFPIV